MSNYFADKKEIRIPYPQQSLSWTCITLFEASTVEAVWIEHRQMDSVLLVIWGICSALMLLGVIYNFLWKIVFVKNGFKIFSLFSKKFIQWSEISSIKGETSSRMGAAAGYLVISLKSGQKIETTGLFPEYHHALVKRMNELFKDNVTSGS